ncbi:MAG: DnaB-like helicase C-terminal domain-containing protein [Polaromonas sp.]|nr:DnaB-like helicase C-terminal domain-containing protein [Polaromonas sp.]
MPPTPSRIIKLIPDSARPPEEDLLGASPPSHFFDAADAPAAALGHVAPVESALMATALRTPDALWISELQEDDLGSPLYHRAWRAMLGIKAGQHGDVTAVDVQTVSYVAGLAPSESAHLAQCGEVISDPQVITSYVAVLKEESARRDFAAALRDIQDSALTPVPVATLVSQATQRLQRSAPQAKRKAVAIGQACIEVVDTAVAQVDNQEVRFRPVMTGIHDLDAMTGGLHGTDLIVLAARPSVGKTTCALTIALNAAKDGRHVKIISLEMSRERLARRLLASEAEVDSHLIKSAALTQAQWDAVADATLRLSDVPLFIDDGTEADCDAVIAEAEADANEGKLDLLVIDYLQLMDLEALSKESRVAIVSAMSRKLKKLAMRTKRPVLALSQLSRNVTQRRDPRPQMSDLRESGAIEQDADVILMLYEDAKDKDNPNPEIEVIVEKNRDGAKGTVLVRHAKPFNKFMNLEYTNV